MDLLNTTISNIKVDLLQSRVNDILSKLQQAGLFRAIVVESNGNKVILDTAFGQLRGIAPDRLSKGDEIIVRLQPGKSDPTIKVEKIQTVSQTLPAKIVNQLIKIISTAQNPVSMETREQTVKTLPNSSTPPSILPRAIKVLAHTNDKTLLQFDHKTYTIPRQPLLAAGETLLLKSSAGHKPELLRIQPENILKNALSNLLPRMTNSSNTVELTNLQQSIVKLLKLTLADTAKTSPTTYNDNINLKSVNASAEQHQNSKPAENREAMKSPAMYAKKEFTLPAPSQKEMPVKLMNQLLTNLSQPLARLDSFKAGSLQQILGMLSLLKPAAPVNTATSYLPIADNVADLHKAISNSPENFKTLLRHIIHSNAAKTKVNITDNALFEISNTLKTELLQQLEQTLSQLLLQKTTVRLNQELNQPVQINLNIPLQINEETAALKLKIKQQKNNDLTEQNHWEINLSFDLAELGLISTNILLQDTKLSAHFWAVKTSTKQLIDTHLHQFKNQLKKSGFELGLFDCFIGKPIPQDETPQSVAENLVDIKV